MRPLSQVDPWNGCKVCRRQAELGVMPRHNWTHELRMWWNDKVRACARRTEPEPPKPPAIGTSSTAIGLAGIASAPSADKLRKSSKDELRLRPLASCYYAGCLAALLAEKYRPSTVKEVTDAR